MNAKSRRKQAHIVTLGCAKNLVDSEVLMNQLQAGGYEVTHEGKIKKNDIVIVNTCGFINDAKQESIDTILEFAKARKEGIISKLIVSGCLSQRYAPQLKQEIPEIDGVFGVSNLPEMLGFLHAEFRKELVGERLLTTPSHYAYLKVSEGCDRQCSFCAIPSIRGRHVSKTMEEIVREASFLAEKGVKELILIAQDLTWYGKDIYKRKALSELLEKLVLVNGIQWIRLHYSYPADFPLDVLEVIKKEEKICHYLDIPLQHINNRILRSMKRGTGADETRKLIRTIRESIPGIALRTTLITGYPGETKREFDELKEFIKENEFERLGVFTYSHEENTPAAKLADDVSAKVKAKRAADIMKMQEGISEKLNHRKIGTLLKVLIDRREGETVFGRTEYDSPEIDNDVIIHGVNELARPGNFKQVRITAAGSQKLMGIIEE